MKHNLRGSLRRKQRTAKKTANTANTKSSTHIDEFGEYIKKDAYGTEVSIQTESERF